MLPGICALNRRHQKKLSLWHNHCFLSHKQQNAQEGGKEKDLFLYKCNFVLCLCTFLLFCGLSYTEKLTRRGNPDLRWEKSGFGTLASVAFSLPFPARRCRMGMSFHYSCLFKKKKKKKLNFIICCGLFSDVLSWTEKKKSLWKKINIPNMSWTDFCAVTLQINSVLPNVQKGLYSYSGCGCRETT